MFAQPLNAVIQAIHTVYAGLTGSPVTAELGSIEQAQHGSPPRIVWTLQGGKNGTNTRIGASRVATANFLVWLWFDDLDQCWSAMIALMEAIRRTVYGEQIMEFEYQVPTEVEGRHLQAGAVIVLQVVLNIETDVLDTSAWIPLTGATFKVGMASPDGLLDDQLIATSEDAVAGSVPFA